MRAQTSLPALGVALLLLTTTAGLGIAFAEGAFGSAERDAAERRVAVALSERLVGPESSLTTRANTLNATAVGALTERRLRTQYPVVGDRDVRIRLADRTVVDAGTAADGHTVRRIVGVRETQPRAYDPTFDASDETTLPRRTDEVTLDFDPPRRTAIRTVRANGRVVLRNVSGIRGRATVDVSRFETTTLHFTANRSLSTGDVQVTYTPARTTKATLVVTVDD